MWRVYLSSGGQTKGPSTQNVLWNIIYKFGFKIQPVDRLFLQAERTFLARHVHQKLAFSAPLIAYA